MVEVSAAERCGLGYTYGHESLAGLIDSKLRQIVESCDAMAVSAAYGAMQTATRNLGRPGLCAMAISAVDAALWDLKARLLDLPLVTLLGQVHDGVPIYGSGGFTSYSLDRLCKQLAGWVEQGISRVKMKIGREPDFDVERVAAARNAIGTGPVLFVDANGAYDRKQAIEKSYRFAEAGVRWYEEPVSSDDLDGLRLVRDRVPPQIEVAAGEYGFDLFDFRELIAADAVDVVQADVTRCGGITGFLEVGTLCRAKLLPLSAHCAPALSLHVCCAAPPLRHVEYFHDHVRIEHMLFDGVVEPEGGMLCPDLSRPGHGLQFKRQDAARFAV